MQELINAESWWYDNGNTADSIFLLDTGRDEEAILYGCKQADELPNAEQQSAPPKHKSIAEMAEKEVKHYVIKCSDTQCKSSSSKPKRVVAPPYEQSKENIIDDLQHEICYTMSFSQNAVTYRQRYTAQ